MITTTRAADGSQIGTHQQGAQLTHWLPAGARESLLFTSANAVIAAGTPLRGGVPVCFPQFAGFALPCTGEPPALPKHGFARTAIWQLLSSGTDAAGAAQQHWCLRQSAATLAAWPEHFRLDLHLQALGNTLRMQLRVHNPSERAWHFCAALHSYWAVPNVADAQLFGLAAQPYQDSTQAGAAHQQSETALRFAGELDRIYPNAPPELRVQRGDGSLRIRQSGFTDTVVWNPGAKLAGTMADLGADQAGLFVCVEAAQVNTPILLAPGATWQGEQVAEWLGTQT